MMREATTVQMNTTDIPSVVRLAKMCIRDSNIHVNPGICGLEYGDLFQEGCLWLCKAAFTYNAGPVSYTHLHPYCQPADRQ